MRNQPPLTLSLRKNLLILLASGLVCLSSFSNYFSGLSCVEVIICNDGNDLLDLRIYVPTGSVPDSYNACVDSRPSTLFFSEYIEGSSNNKCLEIFNGTKDTIDLSADNYKIEFYRNGATVGNPSIALSGMLLPDSVFVFCDDAASQPFLDQADQVTNSPFYNGDDAVSLLRGTDTLDVIGRIGEDPGSRWGTTSLGTQNRTCRRSSV